MEIFQSKLIVLLLSCNFLPNGHEFMCPCPIPTLISVLLEFCFQHNFLPYWSFPPLHFSGGISTKLLFFKSSFSRKCENQEKTCYIVNSQKQFRIVIADRFSAFKIKCHQKILFAFTFSSLSSPLF